MGNAMTLLRHQLEVGQVWVDNNDREHVVEEKDNLDNIRYSFSELGQTVYHTRDWFSFQNRKTLKEAL